MWDDFIVEFCKVEFLCYEGAPNWLGFVVTVISALETSKLPGSSRLSRVTTPSSTIMALRAT